MMQPMPPPRHRTRMTKLAKLKLCRHAIANPTWCLEQLRVWVYMEFKLYISIPTVSKVLKEYAKLTALSEHDLKYKSLPRAVFREFETKLSAWMDKKNAKGAFLDGATIAMKAGKIAEEMGDSKLKARKLLTGWLYAFQERHGYNCKRMHGEAASADPATVAAGIKEMNLLTAFYAARDVYNFDETNFLYNRLPSKSIQRKKEQREGLKQSKDKITVGLCTNMDGSDKRPALYIGKSKQPRAFRGRKASELGLEYRNAAKAWITTPLVEEWMLAFDADMRKNGRHVVLVMDNASQHNIVKIMGLTNVMPHFIPPNTTSHIQPLDQGIIANAKAHSRRILSKRHFDTIEASEDGNIVIEKLNVLQAMEVFEEGWAQVTSKTIKNCWRKAGVVDCMSAESVPQLDELLGDVSTDLLDASVICAPSLDACEPTLEYLLDDLPETEPLEELQEDSLLEVLGEVYDLLEDAPEDCMEICEHWF